MNGNENQFADFFFAQPEQVDWNLKNAIHVWEVPGDN